MNETNLFIIDLEKIKCDTKINHPFAASSLPFRTP